MMINFPPRNSPNPDLEGALLGAVGMVDGVEESIEDADEYVDGHYEVADGDLTLDYQEVHGLAKCWSRGEVESVRAVEATGLPVEDAQAVEPILKFCCFCCCCCC